MRSDDDHIIIVVLLAIVSAMLIFASHQFNSQVRMEHEAKNATK